MRRSLGILVAVGAATGCVIVSNGNDGIDRGAVLRSIADDVIVPGYVALATEAGELDAAVAAFCSAPDETSLEAARDAYRSALAAWERTTPYAFGPGKDLGPDVSYWPTDAEGIDAAIASADELTAEELVNRGVRLRGLPAIEYLLFGSPDERASLAALTEEPRRCEYAASASGALVTTTEQLRDAWAPEGDDFAEQLASAGHGSETYDAQLEATSVVLTQLLTSIAIVQETKLGAPLGRSESGVPDPDAVECPWSDESVAAMRATMDGLRALLSSSEEDSLLTWVGARNPALQRRVKQELDAAIAAVDAVPSPLEEYVGGADHAAGDAAHAALGTLERTLATDVSAALAISVMFTDNDGD